MICPICGFDMKEENICEKCGYETEKETVADFDALEKIEVNFEEVENVDEVSDDEVLTEEKDLEIDFDEIDNKTFETKVKKSNSWGVSIVSFIAGVLSTLIVVGCLNGTIISYFDKITNGTPYETVESFCDFYFMDNPNADGMVESFSPYLRSQIVSELQQYGFENDVDLNLDVNDDAKFKEVAQFYINLVNDTTTQTTDVKSLEFKNVVYYKSGSEEFENYLTSYKSVDSEANGVSLFANVTFTIKFDVTTVEQETTTAPETTKKKKGNKQETTTEAVTQAPKTNTESMIYNCSAICVKVNDDWKVFDGLKILD